MQRLFVFLLGMTFIGGCAVIPANGPQYSRGLLPPLTPNASRIVVYRDYAQPTAWATYILVDGQRLLNLPQKSFGFADISPGAHLLQLKWQAGSSSGSEETRSFTPGETYYFQVQGVSTLLAFHAKLVERSEASATATLTSCCRLSDALVDKVNKEVEAVANLPPTIIPKADIKNVQVGMSPDEVVAITGQPGRVEEGITGKEFIPFYFGPDTRRIRWIYPGVGYVGFSRHKYTGAQKVVEIITDSNQK